MAVPWYHYCTKIYKSTYGDPYGGDGTLKGYDIVLSLSAESINNQFLELYNEPIPAGRLPDDDDDEYFRPFLPPPKPEYFINHELKLLIAKGEAIGENDGSGAEGIHGYIECPWLSFESDERNVAVMSIRFKNEVEDGKTKESYLRSYDGGRSAPTNIAGWTMSWEVEISHAEVENFMEDLVEASRDPNATTLMTDKAANQLQNSLKGLDPSKFMASSVFCLFEDARILRSFKMVMADGTSPKQEQATMVKNTIATYFQKLREKFGNMPTAQTPYVLGYGISQKPAALDEIILNNNTALTPPYIIPRRFDLSVTPSRTDAEKKYTTGTVNFCMQTFRANASEQLKITDKMAGQFKETWFKTLGTSGIANGENGIMSISRQVFNDYFIHSLFNLIDFDPEKIGRLLCMDSRVYDPGLASPVSNKQYWRMPFVHGWIYRYPYTFNAIECPSEVLYSQQRTARGEFLSVITYSSDFAGYDREQQKDPRLHRRSWINIEIKSTLWVRHETWGMNGISDNFSINSWVPARTVKVISRYKLRFNLVPGPGGTLILKEDPSQSNLPQDSEKILPVTDSHATDVENKDLGAEMYGTYVWAESHNTFKWIGRDAEMKKFTDAAFAANGKDFSAIDDKLQNIFEKLRTTVVLPGGTVFTFKGVNTDRRGNVHTSVNYRGATETKKIIKIPVG